MKKLFTAITLCLSINSFAQTFNVTPNDTLLITTNFNQFGIYDIYQDNISGDTIFLDWSVVEVDIPQGWDYSMCDLGHCYTGIPGGSMDTLFPSASAFLGLNINPVNVSGIATVRVYVYDENFPSQGDTLTWIVTTSDLVSVDENELSSFNVYPNPADNFITIDAGNSTFENLTFEITDLGGRIVKNENFSTSKITIDIAELPAGIYLVNIRDNNNTITTHKLVVK